MAAKEPRKGRTGALEGRVRMTSYDVARLAGVSQSAVSRAFREGASVSNLTRAKVEEAARRLGYAPSQLARSLITQRSRMIGAVITDITARNYPDVLRLLAREIRDTGHQMLLCPVPDDAGGAAGVADLLAFHVDAIVSSALLPLETIEACDAHGIPVVLYNRMPTGRLAGAVMCDHEVAMEALVGHLHAGGLGRAIYLAGPESAPISNDRLVAARRALAARGHSLARVIHGDYSYEGGRAVANAILRDERPNTVICGNDAMALGVMDGFRFDLGIQLPGAVSVTGFDDVQQAAWPTYNLTTLSQPVACMTRTAIRMLTADGEEAGARRYLPAELKIRTSTRGPCPEAHLSRISWGTPTL